MKRALSIFFIFMASWASADENPYFLDKINDPYSYSAPRYLANTESICGNDDLQDIEYYDNRYANIGFNQAAVNRIGATVGVLKSSDSQTANGFCSGTLVGWDLFLTASHCVDSNTVGSDYVFFRWQIDSTTGTVRSGSKTQIVEIVEDGATSGLDYAVVRLDFGWLYGPHRIHLPIPGSYNTLPMGWGILTDTVPGHALLVQHPNGYPKKVDAGSAVTAVNNKLHYSDIDTRPGSSGSPIFDQYGRIAGVHAWGGCNVSAGTNSGTSMQHILAYSSVLEPTPDTSVIEGGLAIKYPNNVRAALLYSQKQSQIHPIFTQNLDDSASIVVSWNKPANAQTEVQFSLNNGSWQTWATYDRYTRMASLCLSKYRGLVGDRGCENAVNVSNGYLHYRFRTKVGSSVGNWRYMKPVQFYYQS